MTTEIIEAEHTRDLLELRELEKIIDVTRVSAEQHWAAWLTIRERKLYLADGYKTWEDYCQKRWQLTSSAVNKKITASKTFDEMAGNVFPREAIVPERHLRALAHFSSELRIEIYEQAKLTAPSGKLTEDHIEKTATRIVQEREEVAREKKRESLGAAPPATPKPSRTARKDTEPTEEDKVTQAAAQHIITNAGPVKKFLAQAARGLRKLARIFGSLDDMEVSAELVLRKDADRIEGLLDDLSAADRKALGCAQDVSRELGRLRKALADKAKLRERFRPALDAGEEHVDAYRQRLAEILHEEEEEAAA